MKTLPFSAKKDLAKITQKALSRSQNTHESTKRAHQNTSDGKNGCQAA
jgi:hypothetical protein